MIKLKNQNVFTPLIQSNNEISLVHQGKTKDVYEIDKHPDLLLMVYTDRNKKQDDLVPDKGKKILNFNILWMTNVLKDIPCHLVAYGPDTLNYLPNNFSKDLIERSVIVKKLKMITIRFIYYSRLVDNLWSNYELDEDDPYETNLPEGLRFMTKFKEPVFTPIRKRFTGDSPMKSLFTKLNYTEAYETALEAFLIGREHSINKGSDLAMAEFELGYDNERNIVIGGECMTPNCAIFLKLKK